MQSKSLIVCTVFSLGAHIIQDKTLCQWLLAGQVQGRTMVKLLGRMVM